ncbi:L-type lectin-domain containing receptor kinase VIII.2-like [Miscanthus floridulus]|uniref:L-type lectin-domain containing receptor kinase VIII.2-like n=1 Tax=Miscanthus floridulus TaxID=154761 RepID=UPI0034579753
MDVQFGEPNGNHEGPDLDSMVTAASANLEDDVTGGVDLTCERTVHAGIDYRPSGSGDGKGGVLEVFVSYAPKRPPRPVFSMPLDLGEHDKDAAFVGFSASTPGSTETHAIEQWSFSTASPSPSPRSAPAATQPDSTPALPPPVANPVLYRCCSQE